MMTYQDGNTSTGLLAALGGLAAVVVVAFALAFFGVVNVPFVSDMLDGDDTEDAAGLPGRVSFDCDPSRFVQGEDIVCDVAGLAEGTTIEVIANGQTTDENVTSQSSDVGEDPNIFFNESFTAGADGVVSVPFESPVDALRVNVSFEVDGQVVSVQSLVADAGPSNGAAGDDNEANGDNGEDPEETEGADEADEADETEEASGSPVDRDPFIPLRSTDFDDDQQNAPDEDDAE